MKKPTTLSTESVSEYREFVQLQLRKRVLEAIEFVMEEEVEHALGCRAYERSGERRGYTTNAVENLNRELRRRTKTRASFFFHDMGGASAIYFRSIYGMSVAKPVELAEFQTI